MQHMLISTSEDVLFLLNHKCCVIHTLNLRGKGKIPQKYKSCLYFFSLLNQSLCQCSESLAVRDLFSPSNLHYLWVKSYLCQKLNECPQMSSSSLCSLANSVFVWDPLLPNHVNENITLWEPFMCYVWPQPLCDGFSGCNVAGWLGKRKKGTRKLETFEKKVKR